MSREYLMQAGADSAIQNVQKLLPARSALASRLLVISVAILALSACGWHLRGAQPLVHKTGEPRSSESQVAVQLVLRQRNNPLKNAIVRSAWENNYVFAEESAHQLMIEGERLDRRVLSVTETGIAAQFQLTLTILFRRQKTGESDVAPVQRVVSWRNYDFDAKRIVAKSQEEDALIMEMREELAQRLIATL